MPFMPDNFERKDYQGQFPHDPRKEEGQCYSIWTFELVTSVPAIRQKVVLSRGIGNRSGQFPQINGCVGRYIIVSEIVVVSKSLN
jgi:hypothetical protein